MTNNPGWDASLRTVLTHWILVMSQYGPMQSERNEQHCLPNHHDCSPKMLWQLLLTLYSAHASCIAIDIESFTIVYFQAHTHTKVISIALSHTIRVVASFATRLTFSCNSAHNSSYLSLSASPKYTATKVLKSTAQSRPNLVVHSNEQSFRQEPEGQKWNQP